MRVVRQMLVRPAGVGEGNSARRPTLWRGFLNQGGPFQGSFALSARSPVTLALVTALRRMRQLLGNRLLRVAWRRQCALLGWQGFAPQLNDAPCSYSRLRDGLRRLERATAARAYSTDAAGARAVSAGLREQHATIYALSTAPGALSHQRFTTALCAGLFSDLCCLEVSCAQSSQAPHAARNPSPCAGSRWLAGRAAVAVIRATGPNARDILRLLPHRTVLPHERTAALATIADPSTGVRPVAPAAPQPPAPPAQPPSLSARVP